MDTACGGDGAEAGQAIGQDGGARRNTRTSPLLDGLERAAFNGRELGAQGVPLVAERDGRHERSIVLRAAADFAAAAFAAKVGVIDLKLTFKHIAILPLRHRLHQLVVDEPCGGVAHAQLPLERQRRQAGSWPG